MCVRACACVRVCTHVRVCVFVYVYVSTYVRVRVHTYSDDVLMCIVHSIYLFQEEIYFIYFT